MGFVADRVGVLVWIRVMLSLSIGGSNTKLCLGVAYLLVFGNRSIHSFKAKIPDLTFSRAFSSGTLM